MPLPIEVRPGATLLITQETHGREFRFKPTAQVADIIMYLLVYSLRKHGMELYGALFMSNHYHLVVRDVDGRHPEFRQHFHSLLARALNHLQGAQDHVFTSREGSVVALLRSEDLLAKLVYTYLNPVAAGLVNKASDWTGASTLRTAMGHGELRRPAALFDGKTSLPDTVNMADVAPGHFTPIQRKYVNDRIRAKINIDESKVRLKRKQEGRGVVGVAALQAVHHKDQPKTRRRLRERRPVTASGCPKIRRGQWQRRRDHVREYFEAKDQLRKEKRKPMHLRRRVLFPSGTYKLWREGHVDRKATPRCQPLPSYFDSLGGRPPPDEGDEPPDRPASG